MAWVRDWRPITWLVLVTNLLFPLWVLHGMDLAERQRCTGEQCTTFGQGSSPLIPMLMIWLFADLILVAAWALTLPRPQGRGPSPLS